MAVLSPTDRNLLDHAWRATVDRVRGRGPGFGSVFLAAARRAALDEVLWQYRPLVEQLDLTDERERGTLEELAQEALAALRRAVRRHAPRHGLRSRLVSAMDHRWLAPEGRELMDDPQVSPRLRGEILTNLDHVNLVLGSYPIFLHLLRPLLSKDGPTTVLDLAAGHGGFALAAARIARDEGLDLRITASDVRREYLAIGEKIARRDGLAVEFRVLDARRVGQLPPLSYDVITCTQALHHLAPGLIALMFEAATRISRRGVLFVDGCRSCVTGLSLALLGILRYRHRAFTHDSWVSARRFFVPTEIELLARLGPWGDRVQIAWTPPGFCSLRCAPAETSG